ncbi:putative efflux protein, MATE family [Halovivax ruber XH-70]|uniref:Multidrug-efflux transporter n=1 Tax=Halovivax ruber (strain DSM 18193 / JCM 13892 / XH-70) TaxID=797302 RepID=L0IA68_HALRX|nr:MATE family efflux transporter [Halovivax ruber]AGB14817.1 putative efflux protein, MATE family [Halovivax ruber XH-70]
MLDVDREAITDGPITRTLLVLAAPLLVQNLVQVGQQLIDTLFLGRHSVEAVAAVGLNFPVVTLISVMTIGVMVGTQVLVSQRVGADELVAGRRAAVNGTALGIVAGAIVGVVAFFLAQEGMALFGAKELTTQYAAEYLAIYALFLPVLSASDVIEGGFVGWGDSRAALYINLLAVVVNVVLDPFLIFGWGPAPELGVAGAALATGLGYGCGFLLGLGMFVAGRDGFALTRDVLVFDLEDCREIVDIGWPTAGQYTASQAARVLMVGVVSAVGGSPAIAAYTIGARISSVAFVPAMGLQKAAQSMIGQNLGADRPERARQTTWTGVAIAAGALTLVGLVQLVIPETLSEIAMPKAEPHEIELAAQYLVILALGYWAIGSTYLLQAGFNGARRTRTSLVATLAQYWVVRLPLALVLAYPLGFDVQGVFWAVTLSNAAIAVGLGAYYHYETTEGMNRQAVAAAQSASD